MSTPALRRAGSAYSPYVRTHSDAIIPQGGNTYRCGKCGKSVLMAGNKHIMHRILGRLGPCCAPTREEK